MSTSGWPDGCCRAATRSRSASTNRCAVRCGARLRVWSCCPSEPKRSWAMRSSSARSPAGAAGWVQALVKIASAGDALAAMARLTGDPTGDLAAATRETVRRKLQGTAKADRLLAVLEGEAEDEQTLGRIFGEEIGRANR